MKRVASSLKRLGSDRGDASGWLQTNQDAWWTTDEMSLPTAPRSNQTSCYRRPPPPEEEEEGSAAAGDGAYDCKRTDG
jgi:hypothetical protein